MHLLNLMTPAEMNTDGTGLRSLSSDPSWTAILAEVHAAFSRHRCSLGQCRGGQGGAAPSSTTLPLPKTAYGWLSVHDGNSRHEIHAHFDASISAVYYIDVPEGAQSIRFYDPRGGLPTTTRPRAVFSPF